MPSLLICSIIEFTHFFHPSFPLLSGWLHSYSLLISFSFKKNCCTYNSQSLIYLLIILSSLAGIYFTSMLSALHWTIFLILEGFLHLLLFLPQKFGKKHYIKRLWNKDLSYYNFSPLLQFPYFNIKKREYAVLWKFLS